MPHHSKAGLPQREAGDVVTGPTDVTTKKSAAEAYYEWQLAAEKAKARNGGQIPGYLLAQSEVEMLAERLLQTKIANISTSSPEWAFLVNMAGSDDRWQIAKKLASEHLQKVTAEGFLATYSLPDYQVRGLFNYAQQKSNAVRAEWLAGAAGAHNAFTGAPVGGAAA